MAADRAAREARRTGRRSARSRLRVAALFAMHNDALAAIATLVVGAAAVGWIAGPAARIWAGAGALYAGALVVSLGSSAHEPELRAARHPLAFRGGLGDGRRRLFRRPADRRPEAVAERVAGQDLVGRDCRRVRRRGARPSPFRRGRTGSTGCSGSGLRPRSSPNSAICSNPRSSGASASRIRAASFPGHGGLMDRLDAFIAASAFAAVFAAANTQGLLHRQRTVSMVSGPAVRSRLGGARRGRGRGGSPSSARPGRSGARAPR